MRSTQVLLKENVPGLGLCGEVVRVAAGYARNYLLPQRIAITATPDAVRQLERRAARARAEEETARADADALALRLGEVELRTEEKADKNGHLYGSVNVTAIAAMLSEEGFSVEEKHVRLAQPLKEVGVHAIQIHVRHDVQATVRLVLSAVGQPPADALPPEPEPEPEPEPQHVPEPEDASESEQAAAEEGAEAP